MTVRVSIPKLRRVRFKDGRQLEVMRQYKNNDRQHINKRLQAMMDITFGGRVAIGGFAFCIWDATGASVSGYDNFIGPVTSAQIPDFARNLLMLRVAEDWAKE